VFSLSRERVGVRVFYFYLARDEAITKKNKTLIFPRFASGPSIAGGRRIQG